MVYTLALFGAPLRFPLCSVCLSLLFGLVDRRILLLCLLTPSRASRCSRELALALALLAAVAATHYLR